MEALDLDIGNEDFELNEEFSNAVDPAIIAQGVAGLGSLAGAFKPSGAKADIKAVCGRKPALAWGKKGKANKAKYEACVKRATTSAPAPSSGGGSTSDALAMMQMQQQMNNSNPKGGGGNKTMLIVGGSLLGIALIGTIVFVAIKK